jgi:hypothetical protein
MWGSILAAAIKALCYIGWHMWEYVYNSDGSQFRRRCNRCGVRHTKQMGKWEKMK